MQKYTRPDPPSQTAFPVASAGYPFIVSAAFATAIFALLGLTTLTLIGLVATFAICGFFRDPDRVVPDEKGAVVSPADGRIVGAAIVESSPFSEGRTMKISIFMSVFNVHVNRIPCDGRVREISYHPGKFISANFDKASLENEHNAVFFDTVDGRQMCVVQVAGLIARRIICNVKPGDDLIRGQRFGLICFGSRLDVYLPPDVTPNVVVGDKTRAGETILGRFKD
jgi:phosphatidylserine decarboxylase